MGTAITTWGRRRGGGLSHKLAHSSLSNASAGSPQHTRTRAAQELAQRIARLETDAYAVGGWVGGVRWVAGLGLVAASEARGMGWVASGTELRMGRDEAPHRHRHRLVSLSHSQPYSNSTHAPPPSYGNDFVEFPTIFANRPTPTTTHTGVGEGQAGQ